MIINPRELKRLQSLKNEYPSVSIYVPTHRTIPEKEQDPIRVKNAFKQAEERLKKEFSVRDLNKILENLEKLRNYIDYTNTLDSIVIFANKNGGSIYNLPEQLEEQVIIDHNFQTRALEKFLDRNFFYWVLALSKKPTRLYMGFKDSLIEIEDTQIGKDQTGPFPTLWEYDIMEPWSGFPYQKDYDVTSDRELHAVEVGHKDSKYLDRLTKEYMQEVDQLLSYRVNQNDPIIILGTPENKSIFESITRLKKNIIGQNKGDFSRENIPQEKLLEQIKPIISEYITEKENSAIAEFKNAIGSVTHAYGLEWTWRVAQEGRIKTLIVEKHYQVPGTAEGSTILEYNDPQSENISDDLVDNLIESVKNKGGNIVFVEPGKLKEYNHIAAILRY